jgi:hypothetical protein
VSDEALTCSDSLSTTKVLARAIGRVGDLLHAHDDVHDEVLQLGAYMAQIVGPYPGRGQIDRGYRLAS